MNTKNIVSVSGGKDSTALWLLAIEQEVDFTPVFADTGNENKLTYEYLDYLERNLGPIKRVKADFTEQISKKREYIKNKWREKGVSEEIIKNALKVMVPTGNPFLDLSLYKTRFPSTMARFCTQELKIIPIFEQMYNPLLDEGFEVVSWQGVRAQESKKRSKLPEKEETPEGIVIYRPLIKWKVEEVFEMHKKHGIEPNPLYKQGMSRVGCMPCINCKKSELYEIGRRYPDEIKRIAEWEKIVAMASKRESASFFPHDVVRGKNVDDYMDWS